LEQGNGYETRPGVFLCMEIPNTADAKSKTAAIVNCASVLSTVAYENDSAYGFKFGAWPYKMQL